MKAIYKKELLAYFTSMIGCVFIALVTALFGIYFMVYNMNYGYQSFAYTLGGIVFLFLIAIPILTMRSFAEERKNRTDQLLLTSPVSLPSIVMGKYLAMVTIFAVPMAISCFFPLIIKLTGTATLLLDYSSILAFFLMGCAYIAIGMFLSSLTESQIIAAITTFIVLFLLHMWSQLMNYLPSSAIGNVIGLILILTLIVLVVYKMTANWFLAGIIEAAGVAATLIVYFVKSSLLENLLSKALGNLSLRSVLENFTDNNLFDIKGLVYYASVIFLFIFLTVQSLRKRRWS